VHVLGLNARRIYGLPARRSGLPGLIDDYFTAVTAQEIDLVRALFTPDAVFESGDVRLQGLDAISGYYASKTFTFDDFRPVPGIPTFDGTRVHVDIDVHMGGAQHSVHDVFETDGRRITALRVSGFEEALRSAALS
jgi:SnoaL-like domain